MTSVPLFSTRKSDEKTTFNGDADVCSSTDSIAVYSKLRKMNITAELQIYANASHGFGGKPSDERLGDWLNRVDASMKSFGL